MPEKDIWRYSGYTYEQLQGRQILLPVRLRSEESTREKGVKHLFQLAGRCRTALAGIAAGHAADPAGIKSGGISSHAGICLREEASAAGQSFVDTVIQEIINFITGKKKEKVPVGFNIFAVAAAKPAQLAGIPAGR